MSSSGWLTHRLKAAIEAPRAAKPSACGTRSSGSHRRRRAANSATTLRHAVYRSIEWACSDGTVVMSVMRTRSSSSWSGGYQFERIAARVRTSIMGSEGSPASSSSRRRSSTQSKSPQTMSFLDGK